MCVCVCLVFVGKWCVFVWSKCVFDCFGFVWTVSTTTTTHCCGMFHIDDNYDMIIIVYIWIFRKVIHMDVVRELDYWYSLTVQSGSNTDISGFVFVVFAIHTKCSLRLHPICFAPRCWMSGCRAIRRPATGTTIDAAAIRERPATIIIIISIRCGDRRDFWSVDCDDGDRPDLG